MEGVYFATISFSKKIVSGLGIFVSGLFLSTAEVGDQNLTEAEMTTVAYIYISFMVILYFLTYAFCGKYKLTREGHERNLATVNAQTIP